MAANTMRLVWILLTTAALVMSYTLDELKQKSIEYVMETYVTPDNLNLKWLFYHLICAGVLNSPGFIQPGKSIGCFSHAHEYLENKKFCENNFSSIMGYIYRHTLSQQGYDEDLFWFIALQGVKVVEESLKCSILKRTPDGHVTFPRPCKEGPCQYVLKDIQEYKVRSLQADRMRLLIDELHYRLWGPWDKKTDHYQYDMVSMTIYVHTKLVTDLNAEKSKSIDNLRNNMQSYMKDPERHPKQVFAVYLNNREEMKSVFEKDLEEATDDDRKSKIKKHLEFHEAITAMMMRGWFIAHGQTDSGTLTLEKEDGNEWEFVVPQVPSLPK